MNSSLWAYFESLLSFMLMAGALRISYEVTRQRSSGAEREAHKLPVGASNRSPAAQEEAISPELAKAFSRERIEAIKRKELRRYKQAQDKKWRSWMEAMSK